MEVFTTRLKELEWEREQLRNERAALQVGVSTYKSTFYLVTNKFSLVP